MVVYSSSLLEDSTNTLPSTREKEFKPVLDAGLDAALQMCEKMAEMRQSSWDRAVFGINCLEMVLGTLEPFEFSRERRTELEAEEDQFVESLTSEHVSPLSSLFSPLTDTRSSIVHPPVKRKWSGANPQRSPLQRRSRTPPSPRSPTITNAPLQTPLSHLPTASPSVLTTCIATFSSFLSTLDTLSSPRLSLLPPRFAVEIHKAALERVSESYGEVWEAVMSENNRYEGRATMLRRSKEEVATLLGVRQ
jgi:hypothetical protein